MREASKWNYCYLIITFNEHKQSNFLIKTGSQTHWWRCLTMCINYQWRHQSWVAKSESVRESKQMTMKNAFHFFFKVALVNFMETIFRLFLFIYWGIPDARKWEIKRQFLHCHDVICSVNFSLEICYLQRKPDRQSRHEDRTYIVYVKGVVHKVKLRIFVK